MCLLEMLFFYLFQIQMLIDTTSKITISSPWTSSFSSNKRK
ncbi:unnamed protein product [Tenebrio molitor]|nr:unnamed protein product [Tenebrio molitor]